MIQGRPKSDILGEKRDGCCPDCGGPQKRHGKLRVIDGKMVFEEEACSCDACRNFKKRSVTFGKPSYAICDDPRIANRLSGKLGKK